MTGGVSSRSSDIFRDISNHPGIPAIREVRFGVSLGREISYQRPGGVVCACRVMYPIKVVVVVQVVLVVYTQVWEVV